MEVDALPEMRSNTEIVLAGPSGRLPLIDESAVYGNRCPKDRVIGKNLYPVETASVYNTEAFKLLCAVCEVDTRAVLMSSSLGTRPENGLHKSVRNVGLTDCTQKLWLVSLLDQVEGHVERLRRDTARLEEEKDTLLSTLDSVKHSELLADVSLSEREDVLRYVDRILQRAHTVEVSVRTERDNQQEDALHQVNMYIDELVMSVHQDAAVAQARCRTFMLACSSQSDDGVADKNFESAILGCTLDDQKRVKKRLQGLLDYFARLNITSCTKEDRKRSDEHE